MWYYNVIKCYYNMINNYLKYYFYMAQYLRSSEKQKNIPYNLFIGWLLKILELYF